MLKVFAILYSATKRFNILATMQSRLITALNKKKSVLVLIPLLLLLVAYYPGLLDPTQAMKFFLLSVFCFFFNAIALLNPKIRKGLYLNLSILKFYGLYLVVALISLSYTSDISSGIFQWLKLFLGFNFLLIGLSYLKAYKKFKLSDLSIFLSIFQFIVVSFLVFELFQSEQSFEWLQTKLVGGLFINPNLTSHLLFLSIPFTLYSALKSTKPLLRRISLISSIISIISILLLGSKTTYIALIFMFLFFAFDRFFNKKIRKASKRKLILLSILGLSLLSSVIASLSYFDFSKTDSLVIRQELWSRTIQSIYDRPLSGHGLGSWRSVNLNYISSNRDVTDTTQRLSMYSKLGDTVYERPHNDFLWIWSEMGIMGLIFYLLIFALLFRYAFQLAYKHEQSTLFYKLLTASLIGYLCIASFSYPLERIEHMLFLHLIMLFLIDQSSHLRSKPEKSKKLFFIVVLLISAGAIYISYNRLTSERHFSKALSAKKHKNWNQLLNESKSAKNFFYQMGSNGTPIDWYTGLASINLGKEKEALNYFKKAYLLQPNHLHLLNNLASTYIMNGQHFTDTAEVLYLKALHINPNFEDARINLSAIYFNAGEIDKAWKCIKQISYDSPNENFKIFIDVILKKKFLKRFELISQENNIEEKLTPFFKSQDHSYYLLYKKSKKENIALEEMLIKDLAKFNLN